MGNSSLKFMIFFALIIVCAVKAALFLEKKGDDSFYLQLNAYIGAGDTVPMTQGDSFPGCKVGKVLDVLISDVPSDYVKFSKAKKKSLSDQAKALGGNAIIGFESAGRYDPYLGTAVKLLCANQEAVEDNDADKNGPGIIPASYESTGSGAMKYIF